MKKFILLWLVFYTGLYLFSADNQNLRIGITTLPDNLNPVYVTDETATAVINKMYDSLFYFNEKGKIKNGLVQDYKYLDNNRILLQIQKGYSFSGGKSLNAEDIVFTLRLLKDKKYGFPYLSALDFIIDIKQTGKYEVTLTLIRQIAVWRNYLTVKILNSQELKGITAKRFRNIIPAGSGPYIVVESKDPNRIRLKLRGQKQFRGMYEELNYILIAEPALTPLKLMNNEIDIAPLLPGEINFYQNSKKWQQKFAVRKFRKFGYTYLTCNLKNQQLNKNIRKIFNNVLYKSNFLKKFLNGKGEIVHSPFLLLNKIIKTKKFKVVIPASPLEFKILTNSESRIRCEFVSFFKKELERYNIKLKPVFLEYHSFRSRVKQNKFDLAVSGFVLDIDFDMSDILSQNGYFNYAGFNSTAMNRYLIIGLQEMDQQKRRLIYLKAHQVWQEELPMLPLFNRFFYVGIRQKIPVPKNACTLMSSTGDFLLNILDWKIH